MRTRKRRSRPGGWRWPITNPCQHPAKPTLPPSKPASSMALTVCMFNTRSHVTPFHRLRRTYTYVPANIHAHTGPGKYRWDSHMETLGANGVHVQWQDRAREFRQLDHPAQNSNMLSQRRRAPVSSKLTRCHPMAGTPTIDVHVNRSESRSSPVGDPSCSSSSSLSCSLLLSSTSSSLPSVL